MSRSDSWHNWSGLAAAHGVRAITPATAGDVAAEVRWARERGTTVKAAGTGHSFPAIARPEHALLLPHAMTGIVAVDREAMTVTARAGTPLKSFNADLEALGLSLHNMGGIAEQTLAGAISTGTHGTGGTAASLSAQVVGLEMVLGDGTVLQATAESNPGVLEFARLGLGALGVLTTVTFAVEPLFCLEAVEEPMAWDEALRRFEAMTTEHDHVDLYWFPHTDRVLTKCNDRTALTPDQADRLPRWRAWLDDDLLANKLFGAQTSLLNRAPGAIPRANRLASRLLGARRYSDVAHRVFTTTREVVFREMEYAVPREAGPDVLREARRLLSESDLRISFPVEVRVAPADDVPLSPAYDRETCYLAFHTHRDADHASYFALMEAMLRAHGGRPHWGKLHTLGADDLAALYARFEEFVALRDRLDPGRVFTNDHLRRILGN